MTSAEIAQHMNTIAAFVGMRDVRELSREALAEAGVADGRVDVAVLTGGAILGGADVFAEAMRAGVARTYALVGGVGHTTETFRARVRELWPAAEFANDASEAEVWDAYLRSRHDLVADVLECRSTNSGANISCLFALLRERGIEPASMLLVQDATMQRRLDACLRKLEPQVRPVNYAAYQVRVVERATAEGKASEECDPNGTTEAGNTLEGGGLGDVTGAASLACETSVTSLTCETWTDGAARKTDLRQATSAGGETRAASLACVTGASGAADTDGILARLAFDHEPFGMWGMSRYLELLMGEPPRLMDAPGGYGPRGSNLIAHVDVPAEVTAAFEALRQEFPQLVRVANPAFATPKRA